MNLNNRGVKQADFTVLRETKMLAVLVETAFVNHSDDASKLKNNPEGFASAIAMAILGKIIDDGSGSGDVEYNAQGKVINTSTLNVRSGPSTNHSVIGTLNNSSIVQIIAKNNGWYKISSPIKGYVSQNYIETLPMVFIASGIALTETKYYIDSLLLVEDTLSTLTPY